MLKYTELYWGGRPVGAGSAPEGAGGGNPPLHHGESGGMLPEVICMSEASAEPAVPRRALSGVR
jgi:hypothetical protein